MSVQLSPATIEVLENFASINKGLMFREGKRQRTVSPFKTICADVELEEDIPSSFGIYDLNNLIEVFTLHSTQTPAVSYKEPDLIVKISDTETITFRCCDPKSLRFPPYKEIQLGKRDVADVEFDLSQEMLSRILRVTSILKSESIVVEGNGTILSLTAVGFRDRNRRRTPLKTSNESNKSSNQYSLEVKKTSQICRIVFNAENWKMMPGAYRVQISLEGIAKFENLKRKLTYWLALEVDRKTQK